MFPTLLSFLNHLHDFYCCVCSVTQLCPTLFDLMDCNPPGSSVLGILQARMLENGLPFPPPGDLPNPGIETVSPVSPALAGRFFTPEPLVKPKWVLLNTQLIFM